MAPGPPGHRASYAGPPGRASLQRNTTHDAFAFLRGEEGMATMRKALEEQGKEISELRMMLKVQQANAMKQIRVLSASVQHANTEDDITYYEPLQYLDTSTKELVINIVTDKIRQLETETAPRSLKELILELNGRRRRSSKASSVVSTPPGTANAAASSSKGAKDMAAARRSILRTAAANPGAGGAGNGVVVEGDGAASGPEEARLREELNQTRIELQAAEESATAAEQGREETEVQLEQTRQELESSQEGARALEQSLAEALAREERFKRQESGDEQSPETVTADEESDASANVRVPREVRHVCQVCGKEQSTEETAIEGSADAQVVAAPTREASNASVQGASAEVEQDDAIDRVSDEEHADEHVSTHQVVKPMTQLSSPVNAGSTTVPVADVKGFSERMLVTISDGSNTEIHRIASVTTHQGSSGDCKDVIVVDNPLQYAHLAGATVVSAPETQLSGASNEGSTAIPVADVTGFREGMSIAIGDASHTETKNIVRVNSHKGLPSDSDGAAQKSLIVDSPLQHSYETGAAVTAAPHKVEPASLIKQSDPALEEERARSAKLEQELLEARSCIKQMQTAQEEQEQRALRAENALTELMQQLIPGFTATPEEIMQQLPDGTLSREIMRHLRRGSTPSEVAQQPAQRPKSGSAAGEAIVQSLPESTTAEPVTQVKSGGEDEQDIEIDAKYVARLEKENKRLKLMLEELKAKIADMMEECRKAGLEVTKIADKVGLNIVMRVKGVFERLYQDAIDRIGRLDALREKYRANRADLLVAGVASASSLPSDILDIVTHSNLIFQLPEPTRVIEQKDILKKRSERGHLGGEDSCRASPTGRELHVQPPEDQLMPDAPPLRYSPTSASPTSPKKAGDESLRAPLSRVRVSPDIFDRSTSLPLLHQNRGPMDKGLMVVGGFVSVTRDGGWR